MDRYEEKIKLLSDISGHLNKRDYEDDFNDDTSMMDDIKKIQTNLYKLWLRLLEWECLLEQQQIGQLQVLIDKDIYQTDCNSKNLIEFLRFLNSSIHL